MTPAQTNSQIEKTATERLEAAQDRLCELVTKHGPKFLIKGMTSANAHEAILACIDLLVAKVEKLEAEQAKEPKEGNGK